MKIFIDSANIDEIKKANDWGVIDGVTTNPTLIAKENKDFKNIIQDIIDIIDGPISVEAMSIDAENIIKESIELSKLSKNIVIKIPIFPNGLKAIRKLDKEHIKTNATLIFSSNQALLAAKTGATYVSIFVGRLDDIGHDGIQIVKDSQDIFNTYCFDTEIISASIRHPLHVIQSAKVGADIITIPFNIIEKMFNHPLTDIGIERFANDWKNINKILKGKYD